MPRSWFRFSLRTMFVLVTLLCGFLAWQMSIVRTRQSLLAELRSKPWVQITTADAWDKHLKQGGWKGDAPATIPAVRRWLGDEAIQEIAYGRGHHTLTQEQLARLPKVFPEANVHDYEVLMEPCHPGCFPRGTLVETPQGPRPIQRIGVGDELTAFLQSGEQIVARVESVFVTKNRLWQVETDGGILLTTETQPLCISTDRPVRAGDLRPGDWLLRLEGGELRPAKVLQVSPTDRLERVFNLVLGDSELFIAGGFVVRSKPPAK